MSIHMERPSPGIVTVTIDSPATVNAITQNMLIELASAFKALAVDKTVRAVVVTGTGRKAFSTGGGWLYKLNPVAP
jgi:enoyl-CoA hydratase/carnithine racemase